MITYSALIDRRLISFERSGAIPPNPISPEALSLNAVDGRGDEYDTGFHNRRSR